MGEEYIHSHVHVCVESITERQRSALFDREYMNMHVPSHEHSDEMNVPQESI